MAEAWRMTRVVDTRRLDLRIKHLISIESGYKAAIKRAEGEYRDNLITRDRYVRIKRKNETKVEKILQKIRKLIQTRNALKAR